MTLLYIIALLSVGYLFYWMYQNWGDTPSTETYSQIGMGQKYRKALLHSETYKKVTVVTAKQYIEDTPIVTTIRGKYETSNIARPTDWGVTNPGGETYVVKNLEFIRKYDHIGGDRYRAKGIIKAIQYKGNTFTFETPWGDVMPCNHNDWLALDPVKPNGVYRIEQEVFKDTYQKVSKTSLI